MTDPINLQIKRTDGTWDIIEAAPLLIEEGHELTPTGTYQLYRGFPEFDSNLFDADALRERYMENIELMGEDNPGYLGELHFSGIGYFEWKYEGDRLQENEVWQIVDCIQDYAAGKMQPMANGIILPKPEQSEDESLYFKYGKDQVVSHIRLEEMEGHFIVLINGKPTAQIELMEEDWEITGGDIYDRDLLEEILRRIKANT
ncbi:hypothetical protein SAMN05216464_105332 [Mucilaginibacter pineti]|uniref:Uncharacterized protein n=1 Tax=Mucilaginibacter pineti TaxID=1391627 RepID=A0A1G7C8V9_9SPHI|nr:hypothetical protein [Mucilaginibacter pineti]SDE35653.1 hypothetical protein SAMN05216464_105332 [Mucilaginibacter pineti]